MQKRNSGVRYVVGEPGEFYLTHVNQEYGRGKSIVAAICNERKISHDGKLVIGSDGTSSMAAANLGAVHCMEEMIGKSLQWAICYIVMSFH